MWEDDSLNDFKSADVIFNYPLDAKQTLIKVA
jgi:hypothetical protein